MHRRPLDVMFAEKVSAFIKRTTIRQKPWPIGQQVMLYHWNGTAYRPGSKQVDICAVTVERIIPIKIEHDGNVVQFNYSPQEPDSPPLWQLEGFDSPTDLSLYFITHLKAHIQHELFLHFFTPPTPHPQGPH